jgi:hypothetical protein
MPHLSKMNAATNMDDVFLSFDPVLFAAHRLGFTPDHHQSAVLASTSKQGILNCSRQWGKSTVTAARAVYTAWTTPESLTLVLSPSARQSAELVRKAAVFLRRLNVRTRGDGTNEISLLLPNGARIVGLPGSEANVRGFSNVQLLLVDEASRVPEDLYLAMTPSLAHSNGDLWLMSTPNGRRGFFFETWSNRDPDWHRISVPATECPRITPEFLNRARKSMSDRSFRQEYLCEFADNDETIFPQHLIQKALNFNLRPLF